MNSFIHYLCTKLHLYIWSHKNCSPDIFCCVTVHWEHCID